MYRIFHLISAIIRQFILPNPYVNIFENPTNADLFNIIIGGTILHIFSFILTGCGYIRGIDETLVGSLGYLLSYVYLTFIITILGYFISNIIHFIVLFFIIYLFSCVLVGYIFNRNKCI